MDLIKYSSDYSSLNLSAYKFSLFSLVISIQSKEKIPNKSHKLFYAEILYPFINRCTDINNKSLFISELKNSIIAKISDINKDLISQKDFLIKNIISLLDENLTSIKTLNDLFSFFKQNLQLIKEISLPENYNLNGEEEIEKNIPVFNIDGIGIIDIFIKKCLLSFKRMSFPKLIKLYEDIIKFTNGEILQNTLDNMSIKEKENYFGELFNKNAHSFFNSELLDKKNNYTNINTIKEEGIFEQNNLGTYNDMKNENNKFNHKLFLIHKFYDYHLKYLYNDNSTTNQTKLHYCLLYLTNLYYDCGYYEHALQILFECVKLSQSNCDHEALLKCFLWLSIIYIQKGNFNLASQCLKTCLIKSFQSNYQLLYLISSIELSNLNFIFGANIGLKKDEKKFFNNHINYNNLEEKIISHSNDFEHLLNNIADYFSLNLNSGNNNTNNNNVQNGKGLIDNIDFDEGVKNNEDINKMICYTNMHQVIDYILQGRYSLCIIYLKIIVKELFEEENSVFNYKNKKYFGIGVGDNKKLNFDWDKQEEKIPIKEFDNELILQLTNLIISVMEYDFDFCAGYLMNIINLNKILNKNFGYNLITEKIQLLSVLMLNKYLSQNKYYNYHEISSKEKNTSMKTLGIYYSFIQEYYNFVHIYNSDEKLISIDSDYNTELLLFLEKCKEYHFNTIYKKASILLVKSYIKQKKFTEAMFILSPMIYYNNNENGELNDDNNNLFDENELLYNNINKYYNDIDENDFQISKDINIIEYNIHDHVIGILYQSYICYENEMYSKVDLLLNQIKNKIDIYCSVEEKFDFYYLYTIVNKSDLYIKDLLKYAIRLNNENKIEKILNLMKDIKYPNFDDISIKINALIEENHNFIEYANSFNCDADGAVEILCSINITNNKIINDL